MAVKLSEKFENAQEFLAYAEYSSGMDFNDQEVIEWYNANPDFILSYTGIMKVLNKLKIEKPVEEEPESTEE
jgi:hypothetical protein